MPTPNLILDTGTAMSRLGLESQPQIEEAVANGLNTAHVFFESKLGSPIVKLESFTSYFHLSGSMMPVRPGQVFRLRLPYMFVLPGSVTMMSADTRSEIHTDGEAVSSDDFQVNTEKGLVFIDESYEDSFVKVLYQAGIGSTNKAPMWLQEAAIFYLPTVLNLTQPTNRNDEYLKVAVEMQKTAAAMVSPYTRETALQLNPMY